MAQVANDNVIIAPDMQADVAVVQTRFDATGIQAPHCVNDD
jgi:hypothetical protein